MTRCRVFKGSFVNNIHKSHDLANTNLVSNRVAFHQTINYTAVNLRCNSSAAGLAEYPSVCSMPLSLTIDVTKFE